MNRLDLTAMLTILGTLVVLGVVLAIGNPMPVTVNCVNLEGCKQLGPYAEITLQFSQPVNPEHVQGLWIVSPPVPGRWSWPDARQARWQADRPFSTGERVTFRLSAGQIGSNGESLRNSEQWQIEIRRPLAVFLMEQEQGYELFSARIDGGENDPPGSPDQITHSGGSLFDYAVSTIGEEIIYSALNARKGIDLWIIRRDGSGGRKLLNCGSGRCTTPAWSPVTNEIAYTRENPGADPNGPLGAPRVWIVNVDNGQTTPLFADPQKIGYGPNWSPDGRKISFWNGTQGGIEVVERGQTDSILLNTFSGDAGCWAPDSRSIYYSDVFSAGRESYSIVRKANLVDGTTALNSGSPAGGFTHPVCHPLKDRIAVTVQKNGTFLNSEIDIHDPEEELDQVIVADPVQVYSNYSWSSDGAYMLFQAFHLGGESYDTEIWIWEEARNATWKLIDKALQPMFLP